MRIEKNWFRKLASLALGGTLTLWLLAMPAQADPIGYSVNTIDDQLYTIDLATGVATAIGDVGFDDVGGLAFQPGTGVLFGLDEESDRLITINLATGAGTAVGSLGFDFLDAGLSFDSSGKLFASSDLSAAGVYSVNPATGAAAFLSNVDPDPSGLAFFGNTLFGASDDGDTANDFVTVDRITGVSIDIGDLVNMDADEPGLDFDASGVLWGVSAVNTQTFTINTTTGLATAVATITGAFADSRFEGLAIVAPQVIPEPSVIMLMGVGLAGLVVASRRRKKA